MPKLQQPNLKRAERAVSRFLNEDDGSFVGSGLTAVGSSGKRKRSRKEVRKEKRSTEKKRKALHFSRNEARTEATIIRADTGGDNTKIDSNVNVALKRPKKMSRKKDSNPGAQHNARFREMVEMAGLSNDGASPVMDEDDKVIHEMERLLKVKRGETPKGIVEDGLDFIFGYKDDANAAWAKWSKETGGLPPPSDDADEGASRHVQETGSNDSFRDSYDDYSGDSSDSVDVENSHNSKVLCTTENDSSDDTFEDCEINVRGGGNDETNKTGESNPVSATYISRAEAYGVAPPVEAGEMTPKLYIPRALRTDATDPRSTELKQTERYTRGLLNRVNDKNLAAIVKDFEGLYQRHSRNDISSMITNFILNACVSKDRTLEHLLVIYASFVASLHHIVGIEVSAFFVQALAVKFKESYHAVVSTTAGDNELLSTDKESANLVILLAYLYIFKVVHSTVVFDICNNFIRNFTTIDIELLLVILQTCGSQLRADDSKQFKMSLQEIASTEAGLTITQTARVRFMLGRIAELKDKISSSKEAKTEKHMVLSKLVRGLVKQRSGAIREPLRVPWADLVSADERGRWWLVGSAWAGRSTAERTATPKNSVDGKECTNDSPVVPAINASNELLEAAVRQRMNSDVRKKVFCAMMGSDDYLDAFERLMALKLPAKQDREIVRILIDNCLQEKVYNQFYALLGVKLCQHNHNHKFTFQYALWDRFKDFEALSVSKSSHLARLIADMLAKYALSLAILKTVEFNSLSPRGVLTFQLLMVRLLTHYKEDVLSDVFERISVNKGLNTLKSSLLVFLRFYVRGFKMGIGSGGAARDLNDIEKELLLRQRLKVAKRWLTRSSGVSESTRTD